tara:strand:- start:158 stop:409 length:252 start_codon:yes stop_codon:yes gene_type:complete
MNLVQMMALMWRVVHVSKVVKLGNKESLVTASLVSKALTNQTLVKRVLLVRRPELRHGKEQLLLTNAHVLRVKWVLRRMTWLL